VTTLPHLVAKARNYAARDIIDDMAGAICKAGGRSWHRAPKALRERYREMARASLQAISVADPAIIAATCYLVDPPTLADFQIAAGAAALLPKTGHPDAGDVLADLARDWRLQIEGILTHAQR